MFWPTDDAIRGLPKDLMNQLLDPVHVGDLIRFIRYHVVPQIQVSVHRKKSAEKLCFIHNGNLLSRLAIGVLYMFKL